MQGIVTLLSLDVWKFHLRSQLSGMRKGFRIGFDYTQFSCGKGKRNNMPSATKNEAVAEDYLKERALGWMQE
jgi:hypothetical protein